MENIPTIVSNDSTDVAKTANVQKNGFRKMYIAALAALSFAVAMGMACGYSASATDNMNRITSPLKPNADQVAWIGSLVALGALFGGVVAGVLSQKFGRKGSLIICSVPFMAGWLFIAYANHIIFLYIGRLLTGMCVGIVCVTTPSYLIEISTPDVRGTLGASFQLFVVIGVLLVNSLGAVLTWEWLAIPSATSVILAAIGMCFVPESPRWLVGKGSHQEAIAALKYLQGDFIDTSAECVQIDEDLRNQPQDTNTLNEIRKPEVIIPTMLAFSLVFFQQASGSNAILFYTVELFKSGSSDQDPNIATIIIDVVLVIATVVSSILMDKSGRKSLLIVSGIGMAIGLTCLGVYEYISINSATFGTRKGWIPLASLIVYIASFSLGLGPIPWLMMAEITPVKYRSLICGAATAVCWLFVFIVTKTFQILLLTIHDYGTYFLYAGFCLLSSIFAFFCLPETKGKQLEEIQHIFKKYFSKKEMHIQEISHSV